jgi:hypothetical protein
MKTSTRSDCVDHNTAAAESRHDVEDYPTVRSAVLKGDVWSTGFSLIIPEHSISLKAVLRTSPCLPLTFSLHFSLCNGAVLDTEAATCLDAAKTAALVYGVKNGPSYCSSAW